MYFTRLADNTDDILPYAERKTVDDAEATYGFRTKLVIHADRVGCMHSDCSSNRWRWSRDSNSYEKRYGINEAVAVWVYLDPYITSKTTYDREKPFTDKVLTLCRKHNGTLKGLVKRTMASRYSDYRDYRLTTAQPEDCLTNEGIRRITANARNAYALEQRQAKQAADLYRLQHAPKVLWKALKEDAVTHEPYNYNLRVSSYEDDMGVIRVKVGGIPLTEGEVAFLIGKLSELRTRARGDNEAAFNKAVKAAEEAGFVPEFDD